MLPYENCVNYFFSLRTNTRAPLLLLTDSPLRVHSHQTLPYLPPITHLPHFISNHILTFAQIRAQYVLECSSFDDSLDASFEAVFDAWFDTWFDAWFDAWFDTWFDTWFDALFDAFFDAWFDAWLMHHLILYLMHLLIWLFI